MKYQGPLPKRFSPEEKLEIIQLARYEGLGFEKTVTLFGITPYRVWRWIRCIEQNGFAGLVDQQPIPKHKPYKHLIEEENLILQKANEWTHLNHRKLAHQIFRDTDMFVSESLVYRILKKHGLIRAKSVAKIEAAETWEKQPQSPNEIWHIDISYIPCGFNEKGRGIFWYLVAVVDGYSRYCIAWDIFADMNKERVFEVADQAIFLAQLPQDKRPKLLSDNGGQFRARKTKEFFKELLNLKQIFTGVNHPETNGKIERLFESAKYEALYRSDYSSPQEARQILIKFFDYYNNRRLHQALDFRTPREVYYSLNQDYTQKRQQAKQKKTDYRKLYWQSGDLLTIPNTKNLIKS